MKPTEDDNILIGLAILAGLAVPLSLLAITNLMSADPFLMLGLFWLIGFGTPFAILILAIRLRYERARRRLLLWLLLGVNAFILVGTVSLVVIGGITGGSAAERRLQDNSYDGNDRSSRSTPPLMITEEQVDEIIARTAKALEDLIA